MENPCNFDSSIPCTKVQCLASHVAALGAVDEVLDPKLDLGDSYSGTAHSATPEEQKDLDRYLRVKALLKERLDCAIEKNIT